MLQKNRFIGGLTFLTFFTINVFASSTAIINNQEVEYKDQTITIPVSSNQINRIVLPSEISSKIVSDEKNLEIEINGKEAFIKFSPIMETVRGVNPEDGTTQIEDQNIKYVSNQPAEVFFITKNKTYSFILVPSKMDAQTILVNHKAQQKEELYYKEKSTPFTNLITSLVKDSFLDKDMRGYVDIEKNELLASNNEINVFLKKVRKGAGFDIYMLELQNKTTNGVKVEERNFLGIIDRPTYAISIFYDNELYEMAPFGKAKVSIIVAGDGK